MDRPTAISRLPETYAEALRLHDAGLNDHAIADRVGVPSEAMALLLRLAEAKVAHLMAVDEPATPKPDPTAQPPQDAT